MPPLGSVFFSRVAEKLSATDLVRVEHAWCVAKSAHAGQKRQSGEAYDTHPLAVAGIVVDFFGFDADALCSALLHDVVEDSNISLTSIRSDFGEAVAHIVDGVSKLESVKASVGTSMASKESTLRKLIAAGGRDRRVFAIKLCDRLHNMRTLGPVGRAKQHRVALETALVYVPLARYVGFQQIATELEALSLRWRFPWRWVILAKWAECKSRVDKRRLASTFRDVDRPHLFDIALQSGRIDDELIVRAFASLRSDRACRALFAIPTFFDVTDSIENAYGRVANLHRHFPCLPGSFVSLTNEGVVSSKVLLRIHALVAEFVFFFPRVSGSADWFTVGNSADGGDFAEVASSGEGNFTRVLRELVEHTSIAVFSPKGQCLSLPRRASGLDFAFAIHTDLGLRASAVRVNGRLCDARVELSSGDIVEVIAGEKILAVPDWEAALRAPRSRANLRHWLRESARDDAAMLGRRLLADAAGLGEGDVARLYDDNKLLSQCFGVVSNEDLWRRVGSGELSAYAVASQLLGSGAERLLQVTNTADVRSRLLLDGRAVAGVQYCDLCLPVVGDAVLAVGSFSGVKIHRIACPQRSEGRASNDVFAPMWASRILQPLPSQLVVKSTDRNGLLADCARAVSNCGITVIAVNTLSSRDSARLVATLTFTVLIRSRAKLEACLSALGGVAGVISAARADASTQGEL